MKRLALCVTLLMVTAAAAAVTASAAPGGAKVGLRRTADGMILVNSSGFTLYAFTRDAKNVDNCMKDAQCIKFWPPLTTTGKPVAGPGTKARLLGTIPYRGARRQVTYAGHPLYTFADDSSPGSTEYVNVSASGGRWPAMDAAGHEVTG